MVHKSFDQWLADNPGMEADECDECDGFGYVECPVCHGECGEDCDDPDDVCDECDGEGDIECDACDGHGNSAMALYYSQILHDDSKLLAWNRGQQ